MMAGNLITATKYRKEYADHSREVFKVKGVCGTSNVAGDTLEFPNFEPSMKNSPCSFQDTEFNSESDKRSLPFMARRDLRNERSRL